MSKYRGYFTKHSIDVNIDNDYVEVLTEENYGNVINGIEDRIKDIKYILEPMKGINEIDAVKEQLNKLLEDLY